jgi:hypothetical protein
VRLADVRLPTGWPLGVLAGLLLVRLRERAEIAEGAQIGTDIAESLMDRWHQVDNRTDALLRATWALLGLTVALLAVAAATLVVAISG